MKKETINKYQGVIYEMVVEIECGKPFEQARRETAHWLRQYDTKAATDLAFCNPIELATAYKQIEQQQMVFDGIS
jgi:hypothetical protein